MIAAIVTALALGLSVQADAEPIHSAPAADILADPRAANADWLFSIVEPRFDAAISAPDDNAPEIAELSVLIRRLTDERHPGGMNLMGVLVMNGIGRTANPDAALGYYERAYRAGNPAAAVNFGTYRLYESELNRQISGFDALQSVVNNADAPQQLQALAMGHLGIAYVLGLAGEQPDLPQGVEYVLYGVDQLPDNPAFNFMSGNIYFNGLQPGAEAPDLERALEHFTRGAENGHGQAAWRAGMMHLSGQGTTTDEAAAYRLMVLSSEAGHDQGMISRAVMLATGQGTAMDAAQARIWYEQAASMGHAHAMRGLGVMYLYGEGGETNIAVGVALLQLAREGGDSAADQVLTNVGPQLPQTEEWYQELGGARMFILQSFGITPDQIYGGQTQ